MLAKDLRFRRQMLGVSVSCWDVVIVWIEIKLSGTIPLLLPIIECFFALLIVETTWVGDFTRVHFFLGREAVGIDLTRQ